jgi:protein-tyrosine-phosphatase/tRNA A37 threonylcarbamoyladenosine synthetase subunit TsaC/SUA5/YrdC
MVIDLRRTEDPRDVVHRAVQALAEGRCVAFPTETDYVIAASARSAVATERLRRLAVARPGEPDLTLVLKSADEVLDWAPALPPVGQRISRRCWPGPVAMLMADDHAESLVHRLPTTTRAAILGAGRLRLRIPGHPLLSDCLRMLAGPVVLAEPCDPDDEPFVTAADVLAVAADELALAIDDGRARYAQRVSTIALENNSFRVVRPGIVSEETLRRLASLMVLFVCTGNTCRSPMAEAMFRKQAADRLGCEPTALEGHGVIVSSAGLAAWGGGGASAHAIEAVAERGGDLSAHESQPLTESLVHQADVILTMTAAHRNAIISQFPEAGGRVMMLDPDRRDVIDPIGGTLETYRKCARQIDAHLAARMDTLAREFPGT